MNPRRQVLLFASWMYEEKGGGPEMRAAKGVSSSSSNKRHKLSSDSDGIVSVEQALLPGLPDHLSQLCLRSVPPPLLFSVCRSWRRLLYSPSFPAPPFLSLYALLVSEEEEEEEEEESEIQLASFDPISSTWTPLPPPPGHRSLLLRHPSFISRRLPVQTTSVSGNLVLLAATDRLLLPALPAPLLFDPLASRWRPGPTLPSPRRWCAAGSAGSRLYVASGFGSRYSSETARSAWVWDLNSTSSWEAVASLKDPRFSREPVEMVRSGKSKLCVVDRKTKQGAIYDTEADRWEEMPPGLVSGWTGPAAALAEEIYVADERSGTMRKYEWEGDTWTLVTCSEEMKGASAMAAGGGRVCVAGAGGRRVTVVDVEERRRGGGSSNNRKKKKKDDREVRTWEVFPPEGKRVMAMHVLPRMMMGAKEQSY